MARIKQRGRGWAYTGAILGGLASIAANVAHSFLPPHGAPTDWAPEPGAVVGAIVWPVFLFITVEILYRTAWPRGWSWGILRWAGLLPTAGVAAFVSYRHLSGLLAQYGEEPIVYYLGPLAVDGLMIMAAGALMAGNRAARQPAATPAQPNAAPQPTIIRPVEPAPAVPVAPAPSTPAIPARPANPVPAAPAPQPIQPHAPSPPSAPARTPARSDPRPRPVPVAATPARSTTDTSVTASDPGLRPQPPAPGLVARGRYIAEAHRRSTGTDIAAGELAVKLRVGTSRAKQVLAAIAESNTQPASVNGSRPTAATKTTATR
jgi:hypothetical protein